VQVRGLNHELGATTADRLRIYGEAAIAGLALTESLTSAELAAAGGVGSAAAAAGGNSTLVHDVPDRQAAAAALPGEETFAQRVRRVLRGEQSAPMTYLNALSSGATLTHPTEWEIQHATGRTPGLGRRAHMYWELAQLRVNLFWFEAAMSAFKLVMWWRGGSGGTGIGGDADSEAPAPHGHAVNAG
jgi:hypothetical protein